MFIICNGLFHKSKCYSYQKNMDLINTKVSKIIVLILFLLVVESYGVSCYFTCQSCTSQSRFSCNSCIEDNIDNKIYQYVKSCQNFTKNEPLYVILCIVVVLLDMFMLAMGFGVYQSLYGLIQLTSILIWVQVDNNGVIALQGTNFAIQYGNSFSRTYGAQFVIVLFIIVVFVCLVISVKRIPHNSTAILIRRKRIIFPLRIFSLVYNMQLFSSLASLSTIVNVSNIDIFQVFITVISILTVGIMYGFVFFICNFKKYKLDDPHYYVILEEMVSTRWWIKNKIVLEMTLSSIIILCFVFGFAMPTVFLIIMLVFTIMYLIYIIVFVIWTKLRYKVFIILAYLCFIGILSCLYGLTFSINSITFFQNYGKAYNTLVVLLCSIFCLAILVQILAQRYKIRRQLISIKNRFILCQHIQHRIQINKYDQHAQRQRVTQFQTNIIYGCELSKIRQKLNESFSNYN